MLDHAAGFLRRQVEPVFPQVAVLQTAVFADLVPVGQQRKLARVAACQSFPGIQDAVVHFPDHGTEVQGVAQQRRAVVLHVRRVDTQQGVAEHRRRAVQVGIGKHQHGAVRVDVGIPEIVLVAFHHGQVVKRQLGTQPAGA